MARMTKAQAAQEKADDAREAADTAVKNAEEMQYIFNTAQRLNERLQEDCKKKLSQAYELDAEADRLAME